MKILILSVSLLVSITMVVSVWSYTDLTPAQVYNRLVNCDTLLLLDVREVSEYKTGHIAEPQGQLPLTPINMPFTSGILSKDYNHLPTDIDIIVYCQSGGRSASASSFLETKGFTRIYNMTDGFSSWTYDYRTNGFGDHSGQWIHASDIDPVILICPVAGDTSIINFPINALPEGLDSLYLEFHFASTLLPVPPNVTQSDLAGLFRITALDRFGLSQFLGDSLILSDIVYITLSPKYQSEERGSLTNQNLRVYVPHEGWRPLSYYSSDSLFHREELILRKWYNVEGFISGIENINEMLFNKFNLDQNYPNPFNPRTIINYHLPITNHVELNIYNVVGQKLMTLVSGKQKAGLHEVEWDASGIASGIYYYRLASGQFVDTKRLVVLK